MDFLLSFAAELNPPGGNRPNRTYNPWRCYVNCYLAETGQQMIISEMCVYNQAWLADDEVCVCN